MAGEFMLRMLNKRGGSSSDYADIVFGTVKSVEPLKITYANDLILEKELLEVSRYLTDWEEIVEWTVDGEKKEQKIVHKNKLEKDDKVVMLREDGGQEFYVFERKPKEVKDKKEVVEWLKKTFRRN